MLQRLQALYARGEKIAMLTCYDATFAKLQAGCGVDALLVGDSLGMVIQGQPNTLAVEMPAMCYHVRCVAAGAPQLPMIADMPYGSYASGDKPVSSVEMLNSLDNARQLLAAGAHMVKLEGADSAQLATMRSLIGAGIQVCAHLGFTPQSVMQIGGYKVQGKTEESAQAILDQAHAVQAAGATLLVLEMVPAALAQKITQALQIPTIGIGAGADCSGQVLVLQDLLGIYNGPANRPAASFRMPRFVRNFLQDGNSIEGAVGAYVNAVKSGSFPAAEHSY